MLAKGRTYRMLTVALENPGCNLLLSSSQANEPSRRGLVVLERSCRGLRKFKVGQSISSPNLLPPGQRDSSRPTSRLEKVLASAYCLPVHPPLRRDDTQHTFKQHGISTCLGRWHRCCCILGMFLALKSLLTASNPDSTGPRGHDRMAAVARRCRRDGPGFLQGRIRAAHEQEGSVVDSVTKVSLDTIHIDQKPLRPGDD